MRIAQLTAGTGCFYCGNCIRDTSLASALRARGHVAQVVPMYLPIMADGEFPGHDSAIFFGGINVYLQQQFGFFRKSPRWLDRWLDSPWLLRAAGARAHLTRARDLGELTISMLEGQHGRQAKELDRLCAWLATDFKPEVINLSNILLAGMAPALRRATGARVVCTLQGEDAFLDSLPQPYRQRAWDLISRHAAELEGIAAVSGFYRDVMAHRMQLDPTRIDVVHNGIHIPDRMDNSGAGHAPAPSAIPAWGYLARMTHDKGLGTLVDAFILIRQRDVARNLQLHIGGTMTKADEPYIHSLKAKLRTAGLEDQVQWFPNLSLDAKWDFLHQLSIFSVPATYGEAFGLYVIEAVAAGVPVIQPRHGAFPEILERLGIDSLCEPDDPPSLAAGAEALLLDARRARLIADRARAIVHQEFTDVAMAQRMEQFYQKVIADGAWPNAHPSRRSQQHAS